MRSHVVAANFGTCHVENYDYDTPPGIFYVICDHDFPEGSELHYTLFNPSFWPFPEWPTEVEPTVSEQVLALNENRTQAIEDALENRTQAIK